MGAVDVRSVKEAYKKQYQQYGDSPLGFLWSTNDEARLRMRWVALANVIRKDNFSSLDFGSGSGDMGQFFKPLGQVLYIGIENNPLVLSNAMRKHPDFRFCPEIGHNKADYAFSCGTLNFKADVDHDKWTGWVRDRVLELWESCYSGMAISFSPYAPTKRESDMWYPSSKQQIIDWLPESLMLKVAVLENYGLHDWTLLAWKR